MSEQPDELMQIIRAKWLDNKFEKFEALATKDSMKIEHFRAARKELGNIEKSSDGLTNTFSAEFKILDYLIKNAKLEIRKQYEAELEEEVNFAKKEEHKRRSGGQSNGTPPRSH